MSQLAQEPAWPKFSIADGMPVSGSSSNPGNAVFSLTLSEPLGVAATVEYFTVDGSAHTGIDYLSTNGLATFQPGQTNASVSIPILGNPARATNETFLVQLRNPENAVLGRCQAAGAILHQAPSNPPPSLSISITRPPDHSIFCPETEIPIVVSVQSSQAASQVEFYEGTTLLGIGSLRFG
jgi:hypothetical protein